MELPVKPWQLPSGAVLDLHAMARRLRELMEMQGAVKNRQSRRSVEGNSSGCTAALGTKPIGGSLTLFIEVEGIEEILNTVTKSGAKITMPPKEQFYGMREFAFEDPDGWVITMAKTTK